MLFQESDTGLPLNSSRHMSQKQDLSMDPMMQEEQQMSMMDYDQSNPTMVPNVNPIISEEQVFDDYREDQMMGMDPLLDSRPGQQQDYYDSEYGSIRSPPPSSSPNPPPQPSHATASVNESKLDSSVIDDSEKSMTPRAMAAFQLHQETIESRFGNNKKYQNDIALSRQESSSSIPCSSDMISVKNIEDREDEYSKMKLALLSDITETSNNGSSTPLAAITSPSLAHGILALRGQEEEHSSVYRNKPTLGPRTRSKDNLESIFGGTIGQADISNKYVSNTSVVHKSLLQDDKNPSLPNHSNIMERIYESPQDSGMPTIVHNSRSKIIDPLVKTATSSASLSSSNITSTCNSRPNRSHNNNYATKDGRDNKDFALNNTSQNKSNNKLTNDVKRPTSPSQAYQQAHLHLVEGSNSYEYSAVPSIATTREGLKHVDRGKRVHRHHKPPGFIKEESFPLDISPGSNPSSADIRTSKVRIKSESESSLGVGDKKGSASTAPNISSSATGDVYTIPELPEEEDASSPFAADGVAKRRMAGRFN